MMLTLPDVLTADQLAHCRRALAGAAWIDGRSTAGHMAAHAKHNQQLAADDPKMIALISYATWERRGVKLEPGKH